MALAAARASEGSSAGAAHDNCAGPPSSVRQSQSHENSTADHSYGPWARSANAPVRFEKALLIWKSIHSPGSCRGEFGEPLSLFEGGGGGDDDHDHDHDTRAVRGCMPRASRVPVESSASQAATASRVAKSNSS